MVDCVKTRDTEEILSHVVDQDGSYSKNNTIRADLDDLVARLPVQSLPRVSDRVSATTLACHQKLMDEYVVKIASFARTAHNGLKNSKKAHASYHNTFKKWYVFPLQDQEADSFVLKRDCGESEALPPIHKISCHHAQGFCLCKNVQ